jgi:transglutaminase-like putative cysteine protease
MCARWWWSGKLLLPWLQRDYIRKAFADYAPLSDHEDDIPYDIDHICPFNDWGGDERTFKNHRLGKEVQPQAWKDTRGPLGDGIGNFRLVGSAENRGDGDADVVKKMPFINVGPASDEFEKELIRWAFPPDPANLKHWSDVSRSGSVAERHWNNKRLQAFQQAVESRAVYLYRRFHDDLEYSAWTSPQDRAEDAVHEQVSG